MRIKSSAFAPRAPDRICVVALSLTRKRSGVQVPDSFQGVRVDFLARTAKLPPVNGHYDYG
jgi:hypothetical protein